MFMSITQNKLPVSIVEPFALVLKLDSLIIYWFFFIT